MTIIIAIECPSCNQLVNQEIDLSDGFDNCELQLVCPVCDVTVCGNVEVLED